MAVRSRVEYRVEAQDAPGEDWYEHADSRRDLAGALQAAERGAKDVASGHYGLIRRGRSVEDPTKFRVTKVIITETTEVVEEFSAQTYIDTLGARENSG